jgi:hypothetical protein
VPNTRHVKFLNWGAVDSEGRMSVEKQDRSLSSCDSSFPHFLCNLLGLQLLAELGFLHCHTLQFVHEPLGLAVGWVGVVIQRFVW